MFFQIISENLSRKPIFAESTIRMHKPKAFKSNNAEIRFPYLTL